MRYTSKQIIERALNLADIANTDFLTHTELTQYINDAWQTVYQWLINKGDKQFVKEVILETAGSFHNWTEFEIPKDLYQICSIKNKMSGRIVERAAESESINSGKYDIINNRIRLYGNSQGPLLLTYWMTPTFISFPDKPIECDIGEIVDYCNNSVLFENGDIYNMVTKELIATITIDTEKTYTLGSGYYVEEDASTISVKNYTGRELNSISKAENTEYKLFKSYNGAILYQEFTNGEYSYPMSITSGEPIFDDLSEYPLYLTCKDTLWIYYDQEGGSLNIYNEETNTTDKIPNIGQLRPNKIAWTTDFDNKPCFYVTVSTNNVYVFTYDPETRIIEYDKLKLRVEFITALLRYGILTSDGTFGTLFSVEPDTELNFPNELYFSLLACDLAMRFAMKMNADTDGLNNLYQNMQSTFMNTLSQADSYTRIRNCY